MSEDKGLIEVLIMMISVRPDGVHADLKDEYVRSYIESQAVSLLDYIRFSDKERLLLEMRKLMDGESWGPDDIENMIDSVLAMSEDTTTEDSEGI